MLLGAVALIHDDVVLDEDEVERVGVGLLHQTAVDVRLEFGANLGVEQRIVVGRGERIPVAVVFQVRDRNAERIDGAGHGAAAADDGIVRPREPVGGEQVHVGAGNSLAQEDVEAAGLGVQRRVGIPVGAEVKGLGLDVGQNGAAVVGQGRHHAVFECLQKRTGGRDGMIAAGSEQAGEHQGVPPGRF